MALSRASGPVYGSKNLLWTYFTPAGSSNGATTAIAGVNASVTVPPYEDWFVTEGIVSVSTHSSVANNIALYLKVEGGSTIVPLRVNGQGSTNAATIMTLNQTGTSTSWSTWATAAVSQGEYEGTYCPAGSSIRLVSSGTSAPGNLLFNMRGYTRFANSTRSEG